MALSAQQKRFASEYLVDYNATQAAIRAGYSENTAYSQGHRLLKHVEVDAEIARLTAEKCMSADEALVRLGQQARAEYARFLGVGIDGVPRVDMESLLAAGLGHLVKKIDHKQHGVTVEFYDAQTALLNVGRNHKLFTDKTEVTGKDGEPLLSADALAAAMVDAAPRADSIAEKAAAIWGDVE